MKNDLVLPPIYSERILRRAAATVVCSSVAILSGRADYSVISIVRARCGDHALKVALPRRASS